LAATDFETSATRGLEGSDTFTRESDICDACLGTSYDKNPRILEAFSLMLGCLLGGIIAAALFATRFWPVKGSPLLSLIVLLALSTFGVAAVIWLALHAAIRILAMRGYESEAERAAEAERFYYLALWAAVTGNARVKRRMLAKARKLGFSDAKRLNDPRLSNIV
jgi:hypothetical protein